MTSRPTDSSGKGPPTPHNYSNVDLESLPEESRHPSFTGWDLFFWRDTPDWYFKTFATGGFMFSFSILRQYLDRHELEVFLPPRAKLLPEEMRRGFRNREMLQIGLWKCSKQTIAATAVAGVYFGGAYYLGQYLGRYNWTDFVVSGSVAGAGLATALIWPPKARTTLLGLVAGALSGTSMYAIQAMGYPLWDESRDFQGYWWGRWIDKKAEKAKARAQQAAAQQAAALPQQTSQNN